MIKFSIVIPILNEGKNIRKLTNLLKKRLKKKFSYEIIFVDDNSQDETQIILKDISKNNKRIKYIIRKNKKQDLTKSCFEGIKKANFPYILIMDGDLQHNPRHVPKMIKLLHNEKLDIVVGSRNFLKVHQDKSLNSIRFFASISIKKLINLVLGFKTNDPLSGFFCFKKKIINKQKLFGKGYKILADILYNSKNLKIKEIEIKFGNRKQGKSKMNIKILLLILLFVLSKFIKKITN